MPPYDDNEDRIEREERPARGPRKTSGLAVASLILGVLSLCLCLLTGVPAVICGGISLSQINASKGRLGGTGLAVAGLLLGLFGTCVGTSGVGYLGYSGYERSKENFQAINNLKQIGIALHNYADTHAGQLPSAAQDPRDPRSGLSWRVHLLPYLEQSHLYQQFRLEEPWDSPHNKTLLSQMPAVFAAGRKQPNQTTTPFRVFVGEQAPFNPNPFQKARFPVGFTDGTSNTLLVVEAADEVPWTKPDELMYDPNAPLPKLGAASRATFYALYGDGSVRILTKSLPDATLRGLITHTGGEVIFVP